MNAHAVATIVGACSSSYSMLGVRTSGGVIDGSVSMHAADATNVPQASASVSAGDEVSHSTAPPTAPPTPPATTFSRASRLLAATS